MKEWHNPRSIKYTRDEVKWLLKHLPLLRSGVYPRDPKDTSRMQEGILYMEYKPGAKFEMPVGIAAELDLRIERAGVDGLMLEFLYASEPDDELFVAEHMAQCLKVETQEISRRIRNALYFVSGNKRKAGSYSTYIRQNYATLSSDTDKAP